MNMLPTLAICTYFLSTQVSAQEQTCAEDMLKWATAVAAADGVHSSKDMQAGVVGACSSIRHPWPAVPERLESALPDTPIERVRNSWCAG